MSSDQEQPIEMLRRRILDIVEAPDYKPIKAKGITRLLGLPEDDRSIIAKVIKRMEKEKFLKFGKQHLVLPFSGWKQSGATKEALLAGHDAEKFAAKKEKLNRKYKDYQESGSKKYLVGTFRRKPSGIGFVRLKNSDPENPVGDVYIAAHLTLDAASGDTVAVELLEGRGDTARRDHAGRGGKFDRSGARQRGDRPESDTLESGGRGMIIKVIERMTDRFVGTYFEEDDWGYVKVDADRFNAPLVVGDPSATTARPGDKVVVEMIHFPTNHHGGEAVIVEVLGKHGVPGIDTLLILREFGLPDHFSEEALQAARNEVHDFFKLIPDDLEKPLIPADRHDATGELVVTIDPADAKDFDDAVSVEHLDNGNWQLGVHIADVSHFVKEGQPIDREAKDRGTSVYLPDRVIPMLPEVLSNALASLQPGKVRLTKSVYIEFTPSGIRTDVRIYKSAIKSRQRLNYEEVQRFLDKPSDFAKLWGPKVCELLLRMHELAKVLRKKRFERGAIEMNMPEVKIDLNADGEVIGAHEYPYFDSNRIIEEFMLAANEAVAEYLFRKQILFLRRVHRAPSLRKLKMFADFVRSLNLGELDPKELLESRFVIQELLAQIAGKPEERAVHFALLRSMQRAEYSPNGEGHYALASDCYAHFTSPIRRYPDLTVHRLLDLELAGRNPKPDRGPLILLGEHCSNRERRAEKAEMELTKLKLIDYLSKRIGMRMEGIIMGIEPFGFFVQGIEVPAEGLVRTESLSDDYYRFDRATHTLTGAREGNVFRLGDRVRIEVLRADTERRQIDFKLLDRISKPKGTQAKKGSRGVGKQAIRGRKKR